jgi:hypothetical protein
VSLPDSNPRHKHVERDYLERSILTARNHRDGTSYWTTLANIFADEIERLWAAEDACVCSQEVPGPSWREEKR